MRPSTGIRSPGATTTTAPDSTRSNGTECNESPSRTCTVSGRNDIRSVRASRPRSIERSSRISAASTKAVITSAVTHSPIAAAATIAISMDSSMLIRRLRTSSHASRRTGQHPTTRPITASSGTSGHGHLAPSATAIVQAATKSVRATS